MCLWSGEDFIDILSMNLAREYLTNRAEIVATVKGFGVSKEVCWRLATRPRNFLPPSQCKRDIAIYHGHHYDASIDFQIKDYPYMLCFTEVEFDKFACIVVDALTYAVILRFRWQSTCVSK